MMEALQTQNFDQAVAGGTHVVDFWAAWCGPCRMQTPILEDLEAEYPAEQLKISKVNVDEEQALAAKYSVQSIPTLLVFKDGELVDRLVGVHMKNDLQNKLKKYL